MNKWIPISEKLPEEHTEVILQYRRFILPDDDLFALTSRCDYNLWTGIGREIEPIAWMPLPEPYPYDGVVK